MSKQHGVPTFLFHPLTFHLPTANLDQIRDQQDGCKVFCGNQYFIFGVINSEWQKEQSHPISTLIVSSFVLDYSSLGEPH